MSWKTKTPPPLSPRKPKIQQQSWEGAPTINVYDPSRDFFDESSSCAAMTGNPLKKNTGSSASQKSKYNKYFSPNAMHQMSDPGTYYMAASSSLSKSPNSPKSPNTKKFDFELSTTPDDRFSRSSPSKSFGSNRRYYEDTSTSDSAPATLASPLKKYEYDYVATASSSPKFESSGKVSQFLFSPSFMTFTFTYCLLQSRLNLLVVPKQKE